MPAGSESIAVTVVVERRETANRWQPSVWHPVGVVVGTPPISEPRVVHRAPGVVHYQLATVPLSAHRGETEGYKRNLSNSRPKVYLLLRFDEGALPVVALATVCPDEALDYLDSADAEEIVEPVAMPEAVAAWLSGFVARHHVDRPFRKRKRKAWKDAPSSAAPPGLRR